VEQLLSLLSHCQEEAEDDMVIDEVDHAAHRECWSHEEVFAHNLDDEDELYPVTVREIADV
jgi:hypothetical protein